MRPRYERRSRWCAVLLTATTALSGCSGGDTVRPGRSPVPGPAAGVCEQDAPCGVTIGRTTHRLADGRQVHVTALTVAPTAHVTVGPVVAHRLTTTESVGRMARRAGAVAAVNGSFFDTPASPAFSGYAGDPLGIRVVDGELLSEAADGRTALILPGRRGGRARVDEVRSTLALSAADGATRELDGVNRVPGRIVGCGGTGGDRSAATGLPESRPRHNQLCVDDSEVVAFTPRWGEHTPPGGPGSTEAVLTADGRVSEVRSPAGGAIPRDGSTLAGVGAGADWLRAHAGTGQRIAGRTAVTDRTGRDILAPGVSVMGAGPALLRGGAVRINAAANGVGAASADARHPRTVAGVKADGTLLLVVFDGRSARSAGVTLREAAEILRELGAVEGLNLDGGGSSTMVVGGEVVNRPSDSGAPGGRRQRKVADAIAVIPRS